jgi:hypothetical protein
MKVDKNTLTQERGKYARLCVEVDLTKPLLAMFTIKERKYNVEYEGLHLLCTTCGKFGHYKEGCPDKMKQPEQRAVDGDGINGGLETVGGRVLAGNNMDGPWVVVQKQKKMRKGKERETPAEARTAPTKGGINGDPKLKGSRFAALSGDMNDLDEVVVTDMEGKVSESCQPGHEKNQEEIMGGNDGGNHDMSIPSGQRNNIKEVIEMSTNEKASKKGKLAARGSQNFKNKINNGSKKGGDNLNVMLREKKIIKLLEDQLQNTNGKSNEVDM